MKKHENMVEWVEKYVAQRRNLGYRLQIDEEHLLHFAKYVSASGHRGPLTSDLMLRWVKFPPQRVKKIRLWLTYRKEYSTNQDYQKIIEQIDKYWKKLFADPITVNSPTGKIRIQPQRTNNIMEQYFRDFKRGNRRKTGNNSASLMLQNMLAQTPLVRNLQNPEYMKILLDGKTSIDELFAEIEITRLREELKNAQQNPEKIPAKIKSIINEPQYPEKLANLLKKSESQPKSNQVLRP